MPPAEQNGIFIVAVAHHLPPGVPAEAPTGITMPTGNLVHPVGAYCKIKAPCKTVVYKALAVPPKGIEPLSKEPESSILSIKLQGHLCS